MTALSLPVVPLEGGLQKYFREIWKFPILDADEEYMLAQRYRQHEDAEAAHKLVTSHLRLVAKIAMGYRGYGLPVADLVSEGNVGLMKAVKKFEPERGFRLSTYAMWWIRASITEYILKSWSMVKLGTMSAQKKLFFSLRGIKNKMKIFDSGELTPEDAKRLAEAMHVSEDDVQNMNRRLMSRDLSLNAPMSRDEDDAAEFQDALIDERANPEARLGESEETSVRGRLLKDALASLPERDRKILVERRLKDEPATLEDLGRDLGISRERVRQLEVRAFDRLQKKVMELSAQPAA